MVAIKESAGKRVLMIVENSTYPGDPRVRRESRALAEAGYHVSVIAPGRRDQRWHDVVKGVHVYRYPSPVDISGFLGYFWEYGYCLIASFIVSLVVLMREGFDVIHTSNPPDIFVLLALVYKPFGKRFIFDHHDLAPEMYDAIFEGKSSRLMHDGLVFFEKLSCRFADRVIATNESYKQIEIERDHVAADRITVVRNGPDLDRLQIAEPDPELRRRAKTIIGFVGVMGPQDRVDYLIRAAYHLVHDFHRTDFFCVLVGFGECRTALQELTRELGLDEHVWFTGMIPDAELARCISTADICVDPDPINPFTTRSTMLKLMEYMSFGKPIVAFDLLEHHNSADGAALYVANNDALELARGIAALMDDPARRAMMGNLGRQRVVEKLAWDYSVPHLLQVYEGLFSETQAQSRPGALDKLARWRHWFSQRDPGYIAARLYALVERYGLTAEKAKQRTRTCVQALGEYGCVPTFPVPGRVANAAPEFCRELQSRGVELAVHAYDHVDFRGLTVPQANRQLTRAAEAFRRSGIDFSGFRCPYLGWDERLQAAIPDGLFKYSSNEAIWWDVVSDQAIHHATPIFSNLSRFYHPDSAEHRLAVPRMVENRVEIPVSLPDDLQLYDGLKLGEEGLYQAWSEILRETFKRGELFVVLFHPESFEQVAGAFERILSRARQYRPAVWVTKLKDVSAWWWEKSRFEVAVRPEPAGLCLEFKCSERATVLMRNIDADEPSHAWDDTYRVLQSRALLVNGVRPLVGLSPALPAKTGQFLTEQGYIVDRSEHAAECGIYLDDPAITTWNEVQLVNHIETSRAPLVRFSRWPSEAKSGLCVTGDLDALSLMDYASRLFGG